jgi:hypothetical protein
MRRLDDDEGAVVVAADEPVERQCVPLKSLTGASKRKPSALCVRGAFTAPRARGELTLECQECRKEAARGQFLLDQDD